MKHTSSRFNSKISPIGVKTCCEKTTFLLFHYKQMHQRQLEEEKKWRQMKSEPSYKGRKKEKIDKKDECKWGKCWGFADSNNK